MLSTYVTRDDTLVDMLHHTTFLCEPDKLFPIDSLRVIQHTTTINYSNGFLVCLEDLI